MNLSKTPRFTVFCLRFLQSIGGCVTLLSALHQRHMVGPPSQRADTSFLHLPSVHSEGGGIMVSYQELFLLVDMIVGIITLMVLLNGKK